MVVLVVTTSPDKILLTIARTGTAGRHKVGCHSVITTYHADAANYRKVTNAGNYRKAADAVNYRKVTGAVNYGKATVVVNYRKKTTGRLQML